MNDMRIIEDKSVVMDWILLVEKMFDMERLKSYTKV